MSEAEYIVDIKSADGQRLHRFVGLHYSVEHQAPYGGYSVRVGGSATHYRFPDSKPEPTPLTPGDLVYLKSGGPKMTVVCFVDEAARCVWFNDDASVHERNFPLSTLERS